MQQIIDRLHEQGELSPEAFVDTCLDLVGPAGRLRATQEALVGFARKGGELRFDDEDASASSASARCCS